MSIPIATITPAQAGSVSAGTNQIVCASSPTANLSGSFGGAATGLVWSGAGTFSSTTDPNATYTPTAGEILAGSATVTATAAGLTAACTPSATITILITSSASTANAGPNQLLNYAGLPVQLAGSVSNSATFTGTWSGGSGTYSPE